MKIKLNGNMVSMVSLIAFAAMFTMGLLDNTRGPIFPGILKTFSFDHTSGSIIFTLASFGGLLINISARFWLPFIGARNGALMALFLMFLGMLFMGLSPTLQLREAILYGSSFILGIGMSAIGMSTNILIIQAVSVEKRRRALSALHSLYGLSSFVAPFLYFLSLKALLHWQTHLILLSIIPLFLTCLFTSILIYQNKKLEDKNFEHSKISPPFSLLYRLPYAILFGSYVSAEILISTRLVVYLQEIKGLDEKHSNQMLSFFFIFLTLGRVLISLIDLKKWKSEHLMFISLLSTLAIFLLGYNFSYTFYPFLGFTMSYFFPVGIEWLGHHFPKHSDFLITTVLTSMGIFLTSQHYIFGKISTLYGLDFSFSLIALNLIIALIALMTIQHFNHFKKTK